MLEVEMVVNGNELIRVFHITDGMSNNWLFTEVSIDDVGKESKVLGYSRKLML